MRWGEVKLRWVVGGVGVSAVTCGVGHDHFLPPLRKGINSERVRSSPSASAIVDSRLIELSRICAIVWV